MIYSIPKDKSKMIFDFYMLEAAMNYPTRGRKVGAEMYSLWDFKQDKFHEEVKAFEDELLNEIKLELLRVVYFSVVSEYRHAFVRGVHKDLKDHDLKEFHTKYANIQTDIYQNLKNSNCIKDVCLEYKVPMWIEKYMTSSFNGRNSSAIAALLAFPNFSVFMSSAFSVFNDLSWGSSYGGPKWGQGADAWQKLNNAEGKNRYIWIDHIFDLQHNNGTLINKATPYHITNFKDTPFCIYSGQRALVNDNDPCKWIEKALDFKQGVSDPWQFYPFASESVRKICARILHEKGYGSATDIIKFAATIKYIDWAGGTWEDGTWFSGKWRSGLWKNGLWKDGIWKGGTWENGEFEHGIWKNGTWQDGVFRKSGIWENGEFLNGRFGQGAWKNGKFRDGIFNGEWENGEFLGGRFRGTWVNGKVKGGFWSGTFRRGEWYDGNFESGFFYEDLWRDGTFYYGTFKGKHWKKGDWRGGEFAGDIWSKGTWECGTWTSGTWKKGLWKGGVWKDGTWKDGIWKGGTWQNGTWQKGLWLRGYWKDGIWEGGLWHKGEWRKGEWKGGYIFDPDKKSLHAGKRHPSRPMYCYSKVNPTTYWSKISDISHKININTELLAFY